MFYIITQDGELVMAKELRIIESEDLRGGCSIVTESNKKVCSHISKEKAEAVILEVTYVIHREEKDIHLVAYIPHILKKVTTLQSV